MFKTMARVRTLLRDGYVVVRRLYSANEAGQMHAEMLDLMSRRVDAVHKYENGSLVVVQGADVAAPVIAGFLGDRTVNRIVKRYIRHFSDAEPVVNEQTEFEHNVGRGGTNNSHWHFDRFPCVKAALFLTDADETNGALHFMPGSHRTARRTALSFLQHNPDPFFVDNFVRPTGREKTVRLDVAAGDVVIFDTCVVHKGGEMLSECERAVIRGVTWPPALNPRYMDGGDGGVFEVFHPYDRTGQKTVNPRHIFTG